MAGVTAASPSPRPILAATSTATDAREMLTRSVYAMNIARKRIASSVCPCGSGNNNDG